MGGGSSAQYDGFDKASGRTKSDSGAVWIFKLVQPTCSELDCKSAKGSGFKNNPANANTFCRETVCSSAEIDLCCMVDSSSSFFSSPMDWPRALTILGGVLAATAVVSGTVCVIVRTRSPDKEAIEPGIDMQKDDAGTTGDTTLTMVEMVQGSSDTTFDMQKGDADPSSTQTHADLQKMTDRLTADQRSMLAPLDDNVEPEFVPTGDESQLPQL